MIVAVCCVPAVPEKLFTVPSKTTAAEVIGRAFLLLGSASAKEKVRVLAERLGERELGKLLQAASELSESLGDADGFKLGAVFRPAEQGECGIDLGDQLIPTQFVRQLQRFQEKSRLPGSSAVG